MPAIKRKKSEPQSAPPRPEAPRRSSRRVTKDGVDGESEDSTKPPNGMEAVARRRSKPALESKKGVVQAMSELGEMERKLSTAAKRQRRAVEDSKIGQDPKGPAKAAFHPRRELSEKVLINDRIKPEVEGLEKAPMEEDDAELAAADLADAKEDDQLENKQVLLTNSDYLPLPWKGRLGYVSAMHER